MNNKKTAGILRIVVLSFILSATIGYSLADWVAPAGGPPSNNVPPPINVGAASQVRDGNLFLNNWLIAKKAQTQSTVDADSGTTVVTKDYLTAKINAISLKPGPAGPAGPAGSAGGGLKWFAGTGCPACPYGYAALPGLGSISSCNIKDQNGTLRPAPNATYDCGAPTSGGFSSTFGFWSY
jgi:hypothetical protein